MEEFDTRSLNYSIASARRKAGIQSGELVEAAATFYSQSMAKALPQSRKTRKIFEFQESRRKQPRTTRMIWARGRGKWFSRRVANLSAIRRIEYQGLARQTVVAAAAAAGLNVAKRGATGPKAAAKARELSSARRDRSQDRPFIELQYRAHDISAFPGRRAHASSIRKSSASIHGWARRLMAEQAREVTK
jgi:hypothetical protein